MSGVRLVARRELAIQLRSKGFLVSVLATVAVVAAIVVIPQLLDREESYSVGLVGASSQALAEPVIAIADQNGVRVTTVDVGDETAARSALDEGEIDAAVVDAEVVLTDGELAPGLSGVLQGAHEALQFGARLSALDLSEQEIGQVLSVSALEERSISGGEEDDTRQGIALLIMLSLLFLFMTTTVGVGAGVVEEKNSRIVEILLVALKPWQLLTGKLVAFGVLGLIQLLAFAAAGIGAAYAVDLTGELPDGLGQIVAATFVAYVLGFLFFGAMAAALGSLVSRQEEMNGALAPLTAAVVLSYLAAYITVSQPDLPVSSWLAVIPPIASVALPVQIAAGNAEVWQVVVGVGLMVLAIVAIVALGARVYERSVLRTGSRVTLREAFQAGE